MKLKLKQRVATQRAAADIARLFSDRLSPSDEQRISRWRNRSQPYRDDFLDTLNALDDFEKLENDPDLLALINQQKSKIKTPTMHGYWPKLAAAALVLLGLWAGYRGISCSSVEPQNVLRYVTRIGEQKTVELKDGSTVTLNTGSELMVDINDNSRRMMLQRGEVFFDVAKDPLRPFSVALGDRAITALGTQFNIRKEPQKFSLAVIEGVVAIHREGESASPTAAKLSAVRGKRVYVRDSSQRRIEAGTIVEFDVAQQELSGYLADDITKISGWRTGILRFDAVPLYLVVKELNRYSGRKILIEDASVIDLELYASVHLSKLDTALSVLERTLPVKVTYYFDRIVIEGK